MESNLETVANDASTSTKTTKSSASWFDSRSVQQLSERIAAILKVDRHGTDDDAGARKIDLKELSDESRRNL